MKKRAGDIFRRFAKARGGNFALYSAILMPLLFGGGAVAIDFSSLKKQQAALQDAADAAALATVKEAGLKGWTQEVGDAIANAVLSANIEQLPRNAKYNTKVVIDTASRTAEIQISQDHYPYFTASFFPTPQISVTSKATAASRANICVIGLDESKSGTVGLKGDALLTAPDCAVYSNSTALDGMYAIETSTIDAELMCSAGGTKRTSGNFKREPVTNCPKVSDPLNSRPAPVFRTGCDYNNFEVMGGKSATTLSPGVYCGGISVNAKAEITLNPGEYIIKDGPLELGSNATLFGRGVGFYFTGTGADFSLQSGSTVDLEAPETGSLAGLLFYQDRASAEADFVLRSNKASTLVGTIYLPNGNFIIDTSSKVADASAYTAIVSKSLSLLRKPNVVLNTDYDATSVPVPAGVGPQGGGPRRLN